MYEIVFAEWRSGSARHIMSWQNPVHTGHLEPLLSQACDLPPLGTQQHLCKLRHLTLAICFSAICCIRKTMLEFSKGLRSPSTNGIVTAEVHDIHAQTNMSVHCVESMAVCEKW